MELKKTVRLTYQDFKEALDRVDDGGRIDRSGCDLPIDGLKDALKAEVDRADATMAVLGIDVYRYSQLEAFEQSLVPFVLRLLYNEAWRLCRTDTDYFFPKCDEDEFDDRYIDTGDGGFLLFDTPIHALVFAVDFELMLRAFNSFRFYPRLRRALGTGISLRYAMTYGKVFSFRSSYYGSSIITNARMLGKDHLNRFLIDQDTFDWFTAYTRGVENLPCVGLDDLQDLPGFEDYDRSLAAKGKKAFFPLKGGEKTESQWRDVDVLKLGDISAKDRMICVYGLHIHYVATLVDGENPEKEAVFTVTLGNLNTSGIE
jgi:hypothetical protein